MDLRYVYIFFQLVAFMFAISIHESAHAWMASRCGDPTARMLGRITLNPLKHIDPIGTVLLPLVAALTGLPVIGWAKPTPVDPRNFKNPVRDDILTSVAGPASNFLVVIVSLLALGILANTSQVGAVVVHGMAHGMSLDVVGMTPVVLMIYELMLINVFLGIFNLIPVPPLDGSHVLRHFMPESVQSVYDRVGFVGLILLVFFGGRLISMLMMPAVITLHRILANI
jgi:Zn-dependent protease